MALSANKDPQIREDEMLSLKVQDNVHIYRGAIVCIDPATGYALPAADTTGYTFAGIALEEVDNTLTGHAAALKRVRVQRRGSAIFTASGLAQTDVGKAAYVSDDTTIALTSTYLVLIGVISEYISATSCRVTFSAPAQTGTTSISGNTQVTGTFGVTGATTLSAAVAITGHTDIGGGYGSTGADIGTDGAIRTNGTLVVDGASTLTGAVGVAGALTAAVKGTVVDATDTRVITSADYGKVIILTHADNVAVTLPANGAAAGSWFDVALNGDDSLAVVISAATVDTLIGKADAGLDSVTYGAGHRIGAYCRFWSDGTYWHVQNLSDCTMTYTS